MARSLFNSPLISDANLINYYRLNGDATDYKGAANGTAKGLPTYSTGYSPFNDGSKGIWFNNTANAATAIMYVTAPFYSPGASDFTYMCWCLPTAPATGGEECIHNETNGATGHPHIYMGLIGAANAVTYQDSMTDSGGGSVDPVIGHITEGEFATWKFLVRTRSGGLSKNYINGQLVSSISNTLTLIASSNGQIGRRSNTSYPNACYPFPGYMADVAMFSRGLTVQEIGMLWDPKYDPKMSNPLRPAIFKPSEAQPYANQNVIRGR